MDDRTEFIRRVYETAAYFFEMKQEDDQGDTNAIKTLRPLQLAHIAPKSIRQFMLHDAFREPNTTLIDGALVLANWRLLVAGTSVSIQYGNMEGELRALCNAYATYAEPEYKKRRSLGRLIRYLQFTIDIGAGAHSRFDYIVPYHHQWRGNGKKGSGRKEHVIPCAFIRREAVRRLKRGHSVNQLADFICEHLIIVEITKEEQICVDNKWKAVMPDNWDWEIGCKFQRLHECGIEFSGECGIFNRLTDNCHVTFT
jgi:hypothetical protein